MYGRLNAIPGYSTKTLRKHLFALMFLPTPKSRQKHEGKKIS